MKFEIFDENNRLTTFEKVKSCDLFKSVFYRLRKASFLFTKPPNLPKRKNKASGNF